MSYFSYRSVFVFLILFFLDLSSISAQEETPKLPEYSYTEFFRMVEAEKDTIFRLHGAAIRHNPKTDSLFTAIWEKGDYIGLNKDSTIIVDKQLELSNVHFETKYLHDLSAKETFYGGVLNNIVFKKYVSTQSNDFIADNCVFEQGLYLQSYCDEFRNDNGVKITNCTIKRILRIDFDNENTCDNFSDFNYFSIEDNRFVTDSLPFNFIIHPSKSNYFSVARNSGDNVIFNAAIQEYSAVFIEENIFLKGQSNIGYSSPSGSGRIRLRKNNLGEIVRFSSDVLPLNSDIEWNQFKGKIISAESYLEIRKRWPNYDDYPYSFYSDSLNIEILDYFKDSLSIPSESNFNAEMALKGAFYNLYKSKFNRKSSNEVYVEMKKLETRRFKYLYNEDKSFSSYFEWKINQFLEIFSNYGTKPAKAIIFSMYVILFFALIYLFFPNSWDKHGKNRIINRYSFFFKYMNKQAGIHEVYLEDQKQELMQYDQFKELVENSGKTVPKFFSMTAVPLYKWAISGTKLNASLLKRVDIMKGTWQKLPKKLRIWKSILLISAFVTAISYDIVIKMLNALMLSINTFTTLGFGEIPIKGIPRYLAIIEGFIGWFMLTIFSVSLISQLLN